MGALVRKELREHLWVFVLLSLVLGLALFGALKSAATLGSPMVAYQKLVAVMVPVMALLLANRLVVREYMGRTQLFLETLPVSRAQVIAVKWLLGAALLLVPMAICLALTLWSARSQVVLTPHYIALLAIRSGSFIFFAYALAFAIGLTGRYRYPIWGLLMCCFLMANAFGQIEPSQYPPFYLVQESMAYERLQLPLRAVLITCATAIVLIAATFALALAAQGSLVVALSRRMTPGEKSGIAIAVMAMLFAVSMLDARKAKPAFQLKQASYSEGGPEVAVGSGGDQAGEEQLATVLSADLGQLQAFLALPSAPSLSALPDDALDPDVFQTAELADADGVVVRAAFGSEQFDREGFRAYALSAWLQWYSRSRAAREERRWLLDGFTQWMVARDLPKQQEKLALRAALAAQMLQAGHVSVDSTLQQWLTVRERLGPCLSDALAWRMVASLAQNMGEQRFQALNRALLAARPPNDVRASLFEPGLAQLLAQAKAPGLPVLARQFEASLRAEQTRLAASLGQIALPQVAFTPKPMDGNTYEVHYQVGTADGARLPFSVRYVTLGPWDAALPAETLARVDADRSGILPASFVRGTRLFTAVDRREALLGCSVRLAAQRWEVK